MRRVVPERAESRGRRDCQKVSTDRDAVGGLLAADRVERSGHRRNGHFLDRQRAYWRLKVPFQLSPITKLQCLLSAFCFPIEFLILSTKNAFWRDSYLLIRLPLCIYLRSGVVLLLAAIAILRGLRPVLRAY
jgi:hypothetical protein